MVAGALISGWGSFPREKNKKETSTNKLHEEDEKPKKRERNSKEKVNNICTGFTAISRKSPQGVGTRGQGKVSDVMTQPEIVVS